jgi:hypothetical protein
MKYISSGLSSAYMAMFTVIVDRVDCKMNAWLSIRQKGLNNTDWSGSLPGIIRPFTYDRSLDKRLNRYSRSRTGSQSAVASAGHQDL